MWIVILMQIYLSILFYKYSVKLNSFSLLHLHRDIQKIEKGIGIEFAALLTAVTIILGSSIICFVVNWQLAFIINLSTPLIIGISFAFSRV